MVEIVSPVNFHIHIDPDDLDAHLSLYQARRGNLQRLAQRVREGASLKQEERELVSGILLGRKRPAHRPMKRETIEEKKSICVFVHVYERFHGCKREAAVAAAQRVYKKKSRSSIWNAIREAEGLDEDWVRALPELAEGFATMLRIRKEHPEERERAPVINLFIDGSGKS
jgi:hypothetical protein